MKINQMGPAAKIIEDTITAAGHRLTTMEVCFHRFVLAEFNTHRLFSRNSASSRAIPVEVILALLRTNPALPLRWSSEKPGMQGGADLEGDDLDLAMQLLERISTFTLEAISAYVDEQKARYGEEKLDGVAAWKHHTLHKGLLNRPMEWFGWHTVVVSATSWDGFWDQRVSPLAQPEIEAPAALMLATYNASEPRLLGEGEWHLPYVSASERMLYRTDVLKQLATARCCRVSTLHHDTGTVDVGKDLITHDRLVEASPMHASPLEHVATPDKNNSLLVSLGGQTIEVPRFGNFVGYRQYRHELTV